MKKRTRFLIILPITLVIFIAAFWWNFPWEGALRWGLTSAENVSRSRGLAFSCGSSEARDHLSPLFRCGDLQIRHALGGVTIARAEARFHPVASLFNRGIYLEIAFGPGQFEALTGQRLAWMKGTCFLVVRGESLFVKELDMTGDFKAKGSLEMSLSQGRIAHAAVEIETPGETDSMMQALSGFLPLKRVKSGEWRLERK